MSQQRLPAQDRDPLSPDFTVGRERHVLTQLSSVRISRRLIFGASIGLCVVAAMTVLGLWGVAHQFADLELQRNSVLHSRDVLVNIDDLLEVQRLNITQANRSTEVRSDVAAPQVPAISDQELRQDLPLRIDQALARLDRLIYPSAQHEQLSGIKTSLHAAHAALVNFADALSTQTNAAQLGQMRENLIAITRNNFLSLTNLRTQVIESLSHIDENSAAQIARHRHMAYAMVSVSMLTMALLLWVLVKYIYMRDQVEQQLVQATNLWRGTLDTLTQGVGLFANDATLLLWNRQFAQLHGVKTEQIKVGMSALDLIALSLEADDPCREDKFAQAESMLATVRGGVTISHEYVRTDNLRIGLELHPMPPDCFILTFTDLTQVRQAEQLAREQAIRLGTIVNSVPDAIVTVNSSGSIESWNAAAEHMFGYAPSEIIRRNVSILMSEPYAGFHDSYIRRWQEQGDVKSLDRRREFMARHRSGAEFPIDLRLSQLKLGDKRTFVGVIRDISERRAVEKLKNEFIATVSHELRTPLTSITGALSLLANGVVGELPERAQRLINMADKNSQRLGRLINDILDLEKADAGRLSVRLETQLLGPLVQHALDLNRSYGTQFGVNLRISGIDTGQAISVRVDEVRLLQVMANLLSNAIKHSPSQSEVLVEMTQSEGRVRVTIHDSGSGIADAFRDRVFERFAQSDGSDSRLVPGTGLGLAITKQLIELQGGSIGFDSGHSKVGTGQGASFWFELPVVMPHDPVMAHEPLHLKIVVCEHDPDIAETLMSMLALEGCTVHSANRAAAVHEVLDESVAALIMDMDLPEQNGLQLLSELRRMPRWSALPVVVLSAKRVMGDDQQRYASLNITQWLEKPIDRVMLRSVLQRLK